MDGGAASILVADDDPQMRKLLRVSLERESFNVDEALDGYDCLAKVDGKRFDLIILDIMMPKLEGWGVCREIRHANNIPIIILSARGEELDRVLGFELGADDYVVKPFSPRELVARIKALLRRSGKNSLDQFLVLPGMSIDLNSRTVTVNGLEVILTLKEYDLLVFLASNPGKTFTRQQILDQVWGFHFVGTTRTVDTHINTLREKLYGDQKNAQNSITTVWGIGYKFEAGQ